MSRSGTDRRLRRLRRVVTGIVLFALSLAAAAHDDGPPPAPGGIWKAAVPPHAMHGEFGNLDPIGLGAGAQVPADCSLNWTNPDSGKLYCFSSATSLVYFLQNPWANLRNAEAGWAHLHATN
ncbi:MAG TPA: hypothetical protein VGC30_09795 [Dokdonella sp.]